MATVVPPPSKRQRREAAQTAAVQKDITIVPPGEEGTFRACFVDADGNKLVDEVEIQLADGTERNVSMMLNKLLGRDPEEYVPYSFSISLPQKPDTATGLWPRAGEDRALGLGAFLRSHGVTNLEEQTVTVRAEPQAVFRVKHVTHEASAISGHGIVVLCAQFSPQVPPLSQSSSTVEAASSIAPLRLATGGGDNTARIWDPFTATPITTLRSHTSWVLVVAWSPDGSFLATGGKDNGVFVWNAATWKPLTSDNASKPNKPSSSVVENPEKENGKQGKVTGKLGKGGGDSKSYSPWNGHRDFITSIAWEPVHLWDTAVGPRLASSSKDTTIRIWQANTGETQQVLSGHRAKVTCVRWSGTGLIYTASNDKTVKAWDVARGTPLYTLDHPSWVNHVTLSTDHVLRTGYFDKLLGPIPATAEGRRQRARDRFQKAAEGGERLAAACENSVVCLWDVGGETNETKSKKKTPIKTLHGHQKQVNYVTFSPDGRLLASCGWDNLTRIWDGRNGEFRALLTGHVGPVFQACFSADSRLLVTCSRDTTLKLWDMSNPHKIKSDLPGHTDQVFAVDWSPDGDVVASGGADKLVRLWKH